MAMAITVASKYGILIRKRIPVFRFFAPILPLDDSATALHIAHCAKLLSAKMTEKIKINSSTKIFLIPDNKVT